MLKGVGEPIYHIGGGFSRDDDGTLCYDAKRYVKILLTNLEHQHDGEKPLKSSVLLDPKWSPELDNLVPMDAGGINKYQSLIGRLHGVSHWEDLI